MKSTLERELKVREIVEREALEVSHAARDSAWLWPGVLLGCQHPKCEGVRGPATRRTAFLGLGRRIQC